MKKNEEKKEYVEIKCPHCGAVLRFEKEPVGRRVYGMCKTCMKKFEVYVK